MARRASAFVGDDECHAVGRNRAAAGKAAKVSLFTQTSALVVDNEHQPRLGSSSPSQFLCNERCQENFGAGNGEISGET